ncbi:MAG TPA: glycosyltransferase family 2 protein [Chitinophagaceae bacterium]|nr:glycosyltransferase family 2 protein [Chitinophagaceae bacterium]
MSQLKLSIVMPSYNQANYIEEAIQSILNQSYRNFELIIVDGLSGDGAADIIRKYEGHPNVAKVIIEKDKGQTDALHKGFQYCKGDILAWLNSDDQFEDNAFQTVVNEFSRDPSIDVLNGELAVVNDQSKKIAVWPRKKITNKQWMHYPQTIGQPSTFFSAKIFRQVGGINKEHHYAMDYDLFFRFALAGAKFHYIDEYLAKFRVHDQSKTMSLPFKFWKEEFRVFYKLSNKKLFSGFYYWKLRGILSLVLKQYILRSRKF